MSGHVCFSTFPGSRHCSSNTSSGVQFTVSSRTWPLWTLTIAKLCRWPMRLHLAWSIDAGGISLARRPRLYWCSWEPVNLDGAKVVEGREGALPIKGRVELEAALDEQDFLEPGWRRVRSERVPCQPSRPLAAPGRRPAGLALCPPDAVARWKSDLHRFPPYQYREENCVVNRRGHLRAPSIREREVILGFPLDYTRRCMVKSLSAVIVA